MIPKKILPVLLGEALEAYDFLLYGLLAIYFSKIFFPPNSEYALTFSFMLFSIAYIARPIGSIIWGHIADKYGRKPAMMGTLSLMAIPALGMALMPSYETIGVAASILVVVLRFMQGIAFGGETPTIIVSLYELAPKHKRGFYSSFYNPGILIGYLTGIILLICMNFMIGEINVQSYGWRFMFGLSLIFIAILSYLRSKLIETAPARSSQDTIPILITLKKDWVIVLKLFLYLSSSTILFYNLLFHNHLILSASKFGITALIAQAAIVATTIIMFPCIGYLSDKVNKIYLLRINYICIALSSVFLYKLFLTQNLLYMVIGYLLFAILSCVVCATFPAVVVGQASKTCRVSTIGISFGAAVIAGSFIPALNEWLILKTQNPSAPAFLISICAVISLITLYTLKKEEIL